MADALELLKLAKEKFEISPAEEKLFRDTANGDVADYSTGNEKADDPANAGEWTPNRVLRASRIAWLCTDKQASQFVTRHGIQIKGARIEEEFDLMFANIRFPLYFEQCKFAADINFQYARIAALNMSGTHTGPISADGLRTDGPVYLRYGFRADGEVRLLNAVVGGSLDCIRSQFINKTKRALSADGVKVRGHVYLREDFEARGMVSLVGAQIGGDLSCTHSKFTNESRVALNADK